MMSIQAFLNQTQHLARRPNELWHGYEIFYRDFRRLQLNIESPFIPFLRLPSELGPPQNGDSLIKDLIDFSREKATRAPVVFLTDHERVSANSYPEQLKRHSIAILDRNTLSTFESCRDWPGKLTILGRALSRDVGVLSLHPYIPGEPAAGGRFFGRSRFLSQIIDGKTIRNCTIVGNRRIGKTSLLQEVRDRLREVYIENQSIFFAELYGAKLQSTWDAVYLVCDQLNINVPKSYMKLGAISERYVKRFPQLLHKFAHEHQAAVVIFIDEFDKFLEIDSQHNYEFLHLLREAAMAKANCYVLIAGFRRLMETGVRQESPYFNFTAEVAMLPLSRPETVDMINLPLSRLGIDIASTNLPSVIYEETRGQPELVQMYCRAAVEIYAKTNRIPHDNELLTFVHKDPKFSRTILHTFLNNTNAYEQIVCLRLIETALKDNAIAHFVFTVSDVERIRETLDLPLSNAQTATLMNNLMVGSIIERVTGTPGKYHFIVPQLLRFCRDLGISALLKTAEAEARRNAPTIHALNGEPREQTVAFDN